MALIGPKSQQHQGAEKVLSNLFFCFFFAHKPVSQPAASQAASTVFSQSCRNSVENQKVNRTKAGCSVFLLHCSWGAAIRRTASKELFESPQHWSPSLDHCHATLIACVWMCVYEVLCANWKGGCREWEFWIRGGRGLGLCNMNSLNKPRPTALLHALKHCRIVGMFLNLLPLLLQQISRFL